MFKALIKKFEPAETPLKKIILAAMLFSAVIVFALIFFWSYSPSFIFDSVFLLFFTVIIVCSWYGGFRLGFLATLASTLILDYFFIEPRYSVISSDPDNIIRLLLFAFNGIFISGTCGLLNYVSARANDVSSKYRDLVEGIPNGFVWTADPKTLHLDFISQSSAKVLGESYADIIKQKAEWMSRIPADDQTLMRESIQKVIDSKTEARFEHQFTKASGEMIWLQTSLQVMTKNKRDELRGLSIDVTDQISARRRVETLNNQLRSVNHRLRESRDQLNIILEGVRDGITVTDKNGHFVYANQRGLEVCGVTSLEELKNTTSTSILASFELADENGKILPLDKLPVPLALRGISTAEDTVVQYRHRSSNEVRWALINAAPVFDETGEVLFAVTIAKDITEHKKSEKALQVLAKSGIALSSSLDHVEVVENIARLAVPTLADWCMIAIKRDDERPQVIVTHNDPQKLEWTNVLAGDDSVNWEFDRSGAAAVLRTGKSELYSQIPAQFLKDLSKSHEHLEMIQNLGMQSAIIVPLKARERVVGAMTWVSTSRSRQYDEADLKLAEDLAVRAALAVENAFLYQESQLAISVRDEFLSIASHELKTPLTSLILQAEIARRLVEQGSGAMTPVRMQKLVELVELQCERLNRLVDDILNISRINSKRMVISPERFDLSLVTKDVVSRLTPELKKAGCEISLEMDPHIQCFLDPIKYEQIVQNLINNGIKYGSGKPIEVSLTASNGSAFLRVRDYGMGISPEKTKKIFERFERGISAKNISGLGLGLYIVKEILKLQGGTISVVSEIGQGSTFTVELPLNVSPQPTPYRDAVL